MTIRSELESVEEKVKVKKKKTLKRSPTMKQSVDITPSDVSDQISAQVENLNMSVELTSAVL